METLTLTPNLPFVLVKFHMNDRSENISETKITPSNYIELLHRRVYGSR